MRIMIKGGVWKNTEDEILKAAVMKYGKNQWARISSLLVRKSAKQCKARWYEWLDPSIKKTEWTREEDEKLLHLAKLMPTQWRTIAPIVGRTPSQCLERYEKLLDAACAKDENYEPGDDPRKLRPGEIDPNPESKPARPDPVDMDEDEKEMLSEARARLANTRGKKAKRKAREKQLEEARRLASLQKRRELKAAGIDNRHRKRKRKGIDYNAEIPFEKRPPPGFYDVTDESSVVEQPKFPTTIEELEGERRADKEARLRKQDIARNKIAQRQDAPTAILQANKMNDPETVRKRPKMNLPTPQIPDYELEQIAKFSLPALNEELSEGSRATRALLADYAQTPHQTMTPLRTPQRTPAGSLDLIKKSLIRGDEDKSSFVPPTLIEQADEMIQKELLLLLEHDNAKYPLDDKEKKKGNKRAGAKSVSVPVIEEFDDDELKSADEMIKEEAKFVRVKMGHKDEDIDEFVEAHKTCLNDIMYFPTRNSYGLSSVAGNMEKLAAYQDEFEIVKKKMDEDTRKANRLEQKIKLLTNGYQMRAANIWSQIEATFKQMDTAGTEYECFQALQRQEKLAASNRINSIWEDVQKQKELEKTLQNRYGDLLVDQERIYNLMEKYKQEETAAAEAAENIQDEKMAEPESEPQAPEQVEASQTADDSGEMTKLASTDVEDSVSAQVNEEPCNEHRDNSDDSPAVDVPESNDEADAVQTDVSNTETDEPAKISDESQTPKADDL
ncbi:putative transcription factor MYB family [Helianthus annuus]|nr:putative transcription factor MYB family [Helianthus annuus]